MRAWEPSLIGLLPYPSVHEENRNQRVGDRPWGTPQEFGSEGGYVDSKDSAA
jgi:hypothetical protein